MLNLIIKSEKSDLLVIKSEKSELLEPVEFFLEMWSYEDHNRMVLMGTHPTFDGGFRKNTFAFCAIEINTGMLRVYDFSPDQARALKKLGFSLTQKEDGDYVIKTKNFGEKKHGII